MLKPTDAHPGDNIPDIDLMEWSYGPNWRDVALIHPCRATQQPSPDADPDFVPDPDADVDADGAPREIDAAALGSSGGSDRRRPVAARPSKKRWREAVDRAVASKISRR